jgi:16S rRNA (cytosine967-C5)-methyltransferase
MRSNKPPPRPSSRSDRTTKRNHSPAGGKPSSGYAGKRLEKRHDGDVERPSGLEARRAAVETLWMVMRRGRFLEEALTEAFSSPQRMGVHARDRAFARLVVTTVLRRHGELGALIQAHLEKPLPENRGRLWQILLSAAAQLLFLETPPHAAIGLAVEQCKADSHARRFDRLANAVLRRVAEAGKAPLAALDGVSLNVPDWLLKGWQQSFGPELAHRIAAASLQEPSLDLSVKADALTWAEKLGGHLLPTGTVRVMHAGRVTELPGFDEGAWWVQDAAAALPAKVLRPEAGMRVGDLCAAPGGKTAELIAAGADVTAVDISSARLRRVRENLDRLKMDAALVTADATTWQPDAPFDAILLDAPCSATGTIRRHPDILHVRQQRGLEKLIDLQARLLANAATLVKPRGIVVYSTCSLEPEEGEAQIRRFLSTHPGFSRVPITGAEIGGLNEAITPEGDLRTLPCHVFPGDPSGAGIDGFFVARLCRGAD